MHDFRSDLMSGSSAQSVQAMVDAAQNAPAFGHREDREQKKLEALVAELAGFEDALFVPTCTLANQIALKLWCQPGSEVVLDATCHLASVEAASTEVLTGAKTRSLAGVRGHLDPDQVKAEFEQRAAGLALIWLEDTHMRAGGTVMPRDWLPRIARAAGSKGVPIHLDGSRAWNAAIARNEGLDRVCAGAHSLALSLNKALGAPLGSLLLGSSDFIAEAVQVRSAFGAAWRPVGIVAAGAIPAVEGYRPRLAMDHERASRLSDGLRQRLGDTCTVDAPDTNIVLVHLRPAANPQAVLDALANRGVAAIKLGGSVLRFVVHARTDDTAIDAAIDALEQALTQASVRAETAARPWT